MLRFKSLSRSFYVPAIFVLAAGFSAGTMPAQTAAGAAGSPAPAPSTVVEDIVARVNDQIITESDYKQAMDQLNAEAKDQNLSFQELEERRRDLLRDLIDQQLLLSRGKDLDITGENELVRRLDEIRKQNHLDSMEDLEKAAEAQGVSYEDFKANIRNSIITQQVVQQEVSQHLSISPTEIQDYYKAHQSEFTQPESVRLSEILVPTPADPNASQVQAAQAKAEEIETKLKGGASFEELAKSSSNGPTAAGGGDLGVFRHGMLAPEFEDATFKLTAGQFTAPIRTKQGFVILEVTQHTAGGDSFAQVQPQVQQAVFLEHLQPALREYLTKLREGAYIDIKPGFVDSGASPNEIHPTYSAYQPPGPKKKKKFVRTRFRGRSRSQQNNVPSTTEASAAASPATTAPAAPAGSPGSGASAASKAENVASNTQQPGKREKIRYGQAPRESLPPTPADTASTPPASTAQSASIAGADVQNPSAGSSIGAEAPAETKPGKTRYSARERIQRGKKSKKVASPDQDQPPPATADELATQKVQDAPLGLTDQQATKKKKEKGEKTRYAAKPKQPEQTPQPYMGNQQPAAESAPSGTQPPAGNQPAPGTSAASPQ